MPHMNKKLAERILDDNVSSHEGTGVYAYGRGYYWADFNIKVRLNHRIYSEMTDQELDWISKIGWEYDGVLAWQLEGLIDSIKQDKYAPDVIFQTGRSGGWLSCRWYAPADGFDALRLAHAVNRVAGLVEAERAYCNSYDFWRSELDANGPIAEETEESSE